MFRWLKRKQPECIGYAVRSLRVGDQPVRWIAKDLLRGPIFWSSAVADDAHLFPTAEAAYDFISGLRSSQYDQVEAIYK